MGMCSKTNLTNASIVEAAQQVFLREGYENASMDTIARQADVSKATVYAHFVGKEALFVAVMQRLRDEYQEKLAGIVAMEGDGFAYRLTLALTAMLEFMLQPSTLQMFRIIIAESCRFPGIALNNLRSGREKSERMLADIFAKGAEDGEIGPVDGKQAAHFVMAMLKGGLLWEKLVDASVEVSERDRRNAVDTVVATITQLHGRAAQ